MPRYLISFNDGAMDHIPDADWPDVGKESHAVVQEAVDAGVWVFSAGLERQRATVVGTDGVVSDGPYPETKETIISFAVIEAASKDEALEVSRRFWAIQGDGEGDIRQVFGPGD